MKNKNALIFGISGQDGSYLANYLLLKKYKVFGISRKKIKIKNHIKLNIIKHIKMSYFSYTDYAKIKKLIKEKKINEIYFLAGQTKPSLSNKNFIETLHSNLIPVYYIIDIILKYNKKIRFFNSSSCEIFHNTNKTLSEKSKKEPESIYGLSKLISLEMVKFFRVKYSLKMCSGIMFHHESILRDKSFVLKKIITSAKNIYLGKQKKINLGNINVERDWGWAPEYVKLIHKMNNQKKIEDLIIATGFTIKLKNVIKKIFENYKLDWKKHIKIEPDLLRKSDAKVRKANNSRIKNKFKWSPKYKPNEFVNNLIKNSLF